MSYYHLAQVCKNGHLINSTADTDISFNKKYCPDCGAETITNCPNCGFPIHGKCEIDSVVFIGDTPKVDKYCYNCGTPYPWTKNSLLSMTALIYEEETLSDSQKQIIADSLPDIICETPNTNLASIRLKRFLSKAGLFVAEGVRQFIIDFGCELAKKTIGL